MREMKGSILAKLDKGEKCVEFLHRVSGGTKLGDEAIIFRRAKAADRSSLSGAIYHTFLDLLRSSQAFGRQCAPQMGI